MKFTQDEIENTIGDLVPRGLRKEVAAKTATYPSVMYGYFNGDDPRKSPWFETLVMLDGLNELDPAVADAVWHQIEAFYQASRPRAKTAAKLDATHELGMMSKEVADVVVAECDHKPVREVIREIVEARQQLERFETAVFQREELAN